MKIKIAQAWSLSSLRSVLLFTFIIAKLIPDLHAQKAKCMDYGIGVGQDYYMFNDFFKLGSTWSYNRFINGVPAPDSILTYYRVYSDDNYKIVNGAYWTYDTDMSGTINNDLPGNRRPGSLPDTYIDYWDMMMDQGKVLPSGYPSSIPLTIYEYKSKKNDPNQGVDLTKPIVIGEVSRSFHFPSNIPSGPWVLKWKGKGKFVFDGIASILNTSSNTTANFLSGNTYEFSSVSNGRVELNYIPQAAARSLRIESSDASNPITDIQFIYPGMEDLLGSGHNINSVFIEKVSQYKTIRYVDYLVANAVAQRPIVNTTHAFYKSHYLEPLKWDERIKPEWYTALTVHENIIELSNRTKTSPWVNIPYCAGKDYVENMIKLYMDNLDPDLTLYLELGNELWNSYGAWNDDIHHYVWTFGGWDWIPGYNNYHYGTGANNYQNAGIRINQVYKWASSAAGPANMDRLLRVVGTQTSDPQVTDWIKGQMDSENWDALAITWYYDLGSDCLDPLTQKNYKTLLYEYWDAHPNDQQGFNTLFQDYHLKKFRCYNYYAWKNQADKAKKYGKKLLTYEGGIHTLSGNINGPGGQHLSNPEEFQANGYAIYPQYMTDNGFIYTMAEADKSAASAVIFNEVLDSLETLGVELANHYGFAGMTTAWGVWNLFPSEDEHLSLADLNGKYPKFKAFNDRAKKDNCQDLFVNLPPDSTGAGLSIKLDGKNDYIQLDNSLPDETNDYTIEAWIKPTLYNVKSYIFSLTNSNDIKNSNAVYLNEDGTMTWEINSSGNSMKLIGPKFLTGKWYHIGITKSRERYTLYVNGKNVASTNRAIAGSIKNKFSIGSLVAGSAVSSALKGEIDELKIWSIGRSEEEIRDFMCRKIPHRFVPANLKSYFTFDDGNNSVTLKNLGAGTKGGVLQNIGFSEHSGYTVSGAALGDTSKYIYPAQWNAVGISFSHSDGDNIEVNNIGPGAPDGIQLYWINEGPYYKFIPEHYEKVGANKYFGVFTANGTDATYDLSYMYDGNAEAGKGVEEGQNRLLKKDNASIADWKHSGAKLDKASHRLILLCKEKDRGEYNLGIRPETGVLRPGSGLALQYQTPDADGKSAARANYLPDFTDYTITYWAKGQGQIYNLGIPDQPSYEEVGVWSPYTDNVTFNYRFNSNQIQTYSYAPTHGDTSQWFHYAITRKGTFVTLYINGNILYQQNFVGQYTYNMLTLLAPPDWQQKTNVTIDEFTLWNTALDQPTIKEWMCKKITGKHPYSCKNLLLYFNFDEGRGLSLEDKNGSSDIEMVPGYYNYTISGAAVGDESTYDYDTPADISFTHPSGDILEAKLKAGSPTGVHLYRVDNMMPVSKSIDDPAILSLDSSRYWGLYVCTPNGVASNYDVTYRYQGNNQIKDETSLRLLDRFDNSSPLWGNPTAELVNNSLKTIVVPNQKRGEYILGGTSRGTFEFKPPAKPIFISEIPNLNNKIICGNSSGIVYKVQKDPTVVSYKWTLPEELDGSSLGDSIILSASYFGPVPKTIVLSVVALNGTGKSDSSNYSITINPRPTLADAGPDQMIVPPGTSALMDGNIAGANETGNWSIKKGNGTIALVTNPKTNISNLQSGKNVFVWTIKQNTGTCPGSADSVNIILSPAPLDITLSDGGLLPLYICGNTSISIHAIPPEGIVPDKYIWELPKGLSLINQTGNQATIQSTSTGIGGTIKVKAIYGNSNVASLPFESASISIKSQPNKPVFLNPPTGICYNVEGTISAAVDPTISNYVWTLPTGITSNSYPISTSAEIKIKANDMVEGYISLRSFNDGCTNGDGVDSIYVKVKTTPTVPTIYTIPNPSYGSLRCKSAFIYSVNNPEPGMEYIWTWEEKRTRLVEYFGSNHSSASFIDVSPTSYDGTSISVYAKRMDSSECNISAPFVIWSWPTHVTGHKADSIIISDPSGQRPSEMEVGKTYTLKTSCSTCIAGVDPSLNPPTENWLDHYFWNLPDGISMIPDNDPFDSTITIKINKSVAAPIRVWPLTLKGCIAAGDTLVVSTPDALMAPVYISGDTVVCAGAPLKITVKNVGAEKYIWQFPDGSSDTTSSNLLNTTINEGLKGELLVRASKGNFISEAAKINLFVKASTLSPLTFYDGNKQKINSLEACSAGSVWDYLTIKINDNYAKEYVWEIPGSVIQFEPRWANFDKNGNGIIDTVDPVTKIPYDPYNDPRMEKNTESPHTSGTDTTQFFTFQSWRLSSGITNGYITVTSRNGCSGNNRRDSLYYSVAVPPAQQQPVFRQAPTTVCSGSKVTYTIDSIPNAQEYIWTLPSGLSSVELITAIPQITVDIGNGTGGKIMVRGYSKVCGGGYTPYGQTDDIQIKGKPLDFKFIDAPLAGCKGETLNFKVSDIGVSKYTWMVPNGLGSDTIGGPSMDFIVKNKISGSVCVSFSMDVCPVPYMVCTDEVNLTEQVGDPVFSSQINLVCPGETYTYTATDIGADSYTWILPEGWKIGTKAGTVEGQPRSVQITAGTFPGPVKIEMYGELKCSNKTSKHVSTNNINFKASCASQVVSPIFNEQHIDICQGQVVEYSVIAVPDAQSYQWTLPAGLFESASGDSGIVKTETNFISVKGMSAGKKGYVKVKVITANAESAETPTNSEVTVHNPETEINLTGNSTICEGSSAMLSSTSSLRNQWYKDGVLLAGEISQTYLAKTSGNYNLIVNDGFCVSDSSGHEKLIIVTPLFQSMITPSGITNICEGDSVILNSSSATGNQWYKDGVALTTETSQELTVNTYGNYNVVYTSGTCNSDSTGAGRKVSVQAKPKTNIVLVGDTQFCDGDSVILSSSSDKENQWYKNGQSLIGASGQNYFVKKSGYYNLIVSAGRCSSDSIGKGIRLTSMSADTTLAINTNDVCKDAPGLLTISSAEANTRYNVFVNNQSIGSSVGTGADLQITIPKINLNQSVNKIRVEASKGTCPPKNLVQTNTIIVRSINTDLKVTGGTACYKDNATVTITSSQKEVTYEVLINNLLADSVVGTGLDLAINIQANKLSMNGDIVNIQASGFGCAPQMLSDTAMVTKKPEVEKPGQISGPSEFCQNDEVVFSINADAGKSYTWGFPTQAEELTITNNDSLNSMLKLKFNDTFSGTNYVTVRARQGNCLSDTSRLEVKTKLNCNEIFIPNIITPNSGDNNVAWTIEGIQNYPNAEVTIMNRWGSLVWHSKGYAKPWDGKSWNNEVLPTGTYYYIIDLQSKARDHKKSQSYNGSVTIMR